MIWSWDIPTAIKNCRELGYEDKDMIVDTIILSESHPLDSKEMSDLHTMSVTLRAHSISSFFNSMRLYSDNKMSYPDVNY